MLHALTRITAALLIAGIVFLVIFHPIADPDCWHHLALGREVLEHGKLPTNNVFAHSAQSTPWISTGWLGSVAMYAAFGMGDAGAWLLICTWLVSSLAYVFILLFISGATDSRSKVPPGFELIALSFALVNIALLAAHQRLVPRPDLCSQLMLPLVLMALIKSRIGEARESVPGLARGEKWLWVLPPMFLLWANLHIGFVVGLCVLAIVLCSELVRCIQHRTFPSLHVVVPLVLCFVVWIANPYGVRLLSVIPAVARLPHIRDTIAELAPMWKFGVFKMPSAVLAAFLLLSLIGTLSFIADRGRWVAWRIVAAAMLCLLALFQRRQIGLFAVGIPVLVAPHLGVLANRIAAFKAYMAALGTSLLVVIGATYGLFGMRAGPPRAGTDCWVMPCGATEFVRRARPAGNMFNEFLFGGYLLFNIGERQPVFIDGRNDAYPAAVWSDYLDLLFRTTSIDQLSSRYNLGYAVISWSSAWDYPDFYARGVADSARWRLVYFDDVSAVYVRIAAQSKEFLDQYAYRYLSPINVQTMFTAIEGPEIHTSEVWSELNRALDASNGCASAYALAALASEKNTMSQQADQYRDAAQKRWPGCPLLRIVAD